MRRKKSTTKKLISRLLALLIIATLSLFGLTYRQEIKNFAKGFLPVAVQKNKAKTSQSQNTSKEKKATVDKEKTTWTKQTEQVKIPILMYHAIHVMGPEETANANLIIDPHLFEEQIKALKEAGYYFLSPQEAYRALSQNELPASKVVWLTFDDSMEDFYTTAFPILKKYQAKATNNVITGFTENQRPENLTLGQMREMKQFGMSFQDHTVNHPDLSVSDPQTQEHEMKDSKSFLDQNLNQETIAIAYPSGRYSEITLDIAKKLHYKLGVTTNEGLASAANGLLSLNRVRMMPNTTPQALLTYIKTD
ncbi:polysaccharide deacetylase family protein [Streptococcus pseudoporcinus]|uniref:Polysaccharide deacetylase n=1 Tax=Streptococcus pseudoporcinus TaxID=361101 RepID=A0A4U9XM27_9STRE|nr:polysaccharide deacetylase family protein [Streptococcus pseudoporcinus]VTS14099.1 polysaccharide deacetylase [Streptococcus pseudoporcinus]VUC67007.1 polysaccharide deacetylase [Streptococcus pseudoporcinus]VUC97935.1 polysaccharide deacetylase [Streptococcus pseudoporcinus]VUC98327.1 polysaccharide deacetylase [Streptococcus pseudoporcinus]